MYSGVIHMLLSYPLMYRNMNFTIINMQNCDNIPALTDIDVDTETEATMMITTGQLVVVGITAVSYLYVS